MLFCAVVQAGEEEAASGREAVFRISLLCRGKGRKKAEPGFSDTKKPFPEGKDFFPEAVSYRVSALSKCSFRTLMDSLN